MHLNELKLSQGVVRVIFYSRVNNVAHQVLCLVFFEKTHAWEVDESFCKRGLRHLGVELYCTEHLQSQLVCANSVCLGSWTERYMDLKLNGSY